MITKTQLLNICEMSNSAQKKHKNVVLVKMATTAQLMLHSISHSERNLTFKKVAEQHFSALNATNSKQHRSRTCNASIQ